LSESIHEAFQHLRESVLQGPGVLSQEERQRIAAWSANPGTIPASQQMDEPLAQVLTKVTRHAYKVTDEDIQGLLAAGYSEDAVFEAVMSAALGTAIARYERGMAVLRATKEEG
jgi:alkylhydroperoxidase family enzyme